MTFFKLSIKKLPPRPVQISTVALVRYICVSETCTHFHILCNLAFQQYLFACEALSFNLIDGMPIFVCIVTCLKVNECTLEFGDLFWFYITVKLLYEHYLCLICK